MYEFYHTAYGLIFPQTQHIIQVCAEEEKVRGLRAHYIVYPRAVGQQKCGGGEKGPALWDKKTHALVYIIGGKRTDEYPENASGGNICGPLTEQKRDHSGDDWCGGHNKRGRSLSPYRNNA